MIVIEGAGKGFCGGYDLVDTPVAAADADIVFSGSFVGANLAALYVFGAVVYAKEKAKAPWLGTALRAVAGGAAVIAVVLLILHFSTGG